MKTNRISEYLDQLFPNPQCELNYNTDYELLISIVLSAQSTDKRVNKATVILFQKYPSLEALSRANIEDIESIIRPVGSFRRKAYYVTKIAEILINSYDGVVPRDHSILTTFPGVGRKTANVFLSEYYHDPFIAVDTHVERVSKRLGLASAKDSVLVIEKKLMRRFPKDEWSIRHLQLVLFGRYYCKAINPLCTHCKLKDICKEKKKKID
jgi:endonuclease-3